MIRSGDSEMIYASLKTLIQRSEANITKRELYFGRPEWFSKVTRSHLELLGRIGGGDPREHVPEQMA